MYQLIRNLLFLLEAEQAHHVAMKGMQIACKIAPLKAIIRSFYQPKHNQAFVFPGTDLSFRNRVGLAAGFDKNAAYLDALDCLGFGFVEIGTVTPVAQDGNERPRLFRLPEDQALINRMGFNNEGAAAAADRLKIWRSKNTSTMLVGGNIGKNKITPNEDAWKDYLICFETLHPWVDYFVVNVSSPNTPGLRALQDKDALRKILTTLQETSIQRNKPKPIFLKIAPDLEWEQIDEVVELAMEIQLNGLVVANTSISRTGLETSPETVTAIGAGGLSGKPLFRKTVELVEYIQKRSEGRLPIIGSGGIFGGHHAEQYLKAGADLVQVWTGFIYEGPSIVRRIDTYLRSSQ